MPSQPTNSGIVTDDTSGERQIPESTRADGSTRKAIKIKPGYRPPEDVEVYKNRTAKAFHDRAQRIGIPGAPTGKDKENSSGAQSGPGSSAVASNKNAKRREARKKAKAGEGSDATEASAETKSDVNKGGALPSKAAAEEAVDPEVEREKKARNLKKKLKQAKDLQNKKEGGEALLPEQIAKVIKINELIRELDALGFNSEGEPRSKNDDTPAADGKAD